MINIYEHENHIQIRIDTCYCGSLLMMSKPRLKESLSDVENRRRSNRLGLILVLYNLVTRSLGFLPLGRFRIVRIRFCFSFFIWPII